MSRRSWHRSPRLRFGPFAGAAGPLLVLAGCSSGPAQPGDVNGRYIVSISDADMPAAAFFDSQLAPHAGSERDSLTVISLPLREPVTPFAQIEVSNSVLGPPNALSVSADGRLAAVIESRGPAPAGARTTDDLPTGEKLTVLDLSNALKPSVLGITVVGDRPAGVDIHPSGDLVGVVTRQPRQQINIVPLIDGKPGGAVAFPLIGVENDEAAPASIAWHPSGDFLGVTIPALNQVMFYRFARDTGDGSFGLMPWGDPVTVGDRPYCGRFTADGRYFVTCDGMREPAGSASPDSIGDVTVIRFAPTVAERVVDSEQPAPRPGHRVVGSAPVGMNPEGLALSPDGRLIAVANIQHSYMTGDGGAGRGGSISLLSLDQDSGALAPAGEYPINAMPVGLSFDARGLFVVVTQFRSFEPGALDGELGFWRVRGRGRDAVLEKTGFVAGVGRGPHGVLIIR
jgi:hypothetical protein